MDEKKETIKTRNKLLSSIESCLLAAGDNIKSQDIDVTIKNWENGIETRIIVKRFPR